MLINRVCFLVLLISITFALHSELADAAQVVFQTFDVEDVPGFEDLAVSSDGQALVAVGSELGNEEEKATLSLINLTTMSFTSKVVLDTLSSHQIGFIGSDKLIILGNNSPGIISTTNGYHPIFAVSIDPLQVLDEVEILGQPLNWEIGSDGNLYVVSGDPGILTEIDPENFVKLNEFSIGGQPVILMKDENIILISDFEALKVKIFDVSLQSVTGEIQL